MAHQVDGRLGDNQQIGFALVEEGVAFIRAGRIHFEGAVISGRPHGAVPGGSFRIVAYKHAVAILLFLINHLPIHKVAYDFRADTSDRNQIPIGPLHVVCLFGQHQRLPFFFLIGNHLLYGWRELLADQLAHRFGERQFFLPHDKINGAAFDTIIGARPLEKAVVFGEDVKPAAVLHVDSFAASFFRLISIATGQGQNIHAVCLSNLILGKFLIRSGASSHITSPHSSRSGSCSSLLSITGSCVIS